ncbi:hypothetical protein BDV3_000621 [Batrachochytrium dendrobatidis]
MDQPTAEEGMTQVLKECTDVHCHLTDSTPTLDDIGKLPVSKIILMGTKLDNWALVEQTAVQFPSKVIPAFGIHPWMSSSSVPPYSTWTANETLNPALPTDTESEVSDIQTPSLVPDTQWLNGLKALLLKHPQAIVGEIGLDGAAKDRSTGELYSMDQQMQVFQAQMQLAIELERPVSMHAVHVHSQITHYFRDMDKICGYIKAQRKRNGRDWNESFQHESDRLPFPPAIMMHSFTASKEIGQSLVKLPHIGSRFYFSFSTIVNARGKKFEDRVRSIPHDRILIESDVSNAADEMSAMQSICQSVADIRGWTMLETAQKTTANANAFLRSCSRIV